MKSTSHLSAPERILTLIDSFTVCSSLAISIGGATEADVHLFCFLASLVSTSQGSSPTSWGYTFSAAETGRPFSEPLAATLDEMLTNGQLVSTADGYIPSFAGEATLAIVGAGQAYTKRIELLKTVCNLSAVRGVPGIGRAVAGESQLARAAELRSTRIIDGDELSRTLIQMSINALDQAGGTYQGALPAFAWLDQWESANAD